MAAYREVHPTCVQKSDQGVKGAPAPRRAEGSAAGTTARISTAVALKDCGMSGSSQRMRRRGLAQLGDLVGRQVQGHSIGLQLGHGGQRDRDIPLRQEMAMLEDEVGDL